MTEEMTVEEYRAMMKGRPYGNTEFQAINVNDLKDEPTTRPIGKLSVNKICFNLHRYHCPECGAIAISGVTEWTPEGGLIGIATFACGHWVREDLGD